MALLLSGTGGVVASADASAASRVVLAQNPSNNEYFPLVVGSSWTYRYASGTTAGSTLTISVLSAHSVAGGEAVDMKFGSASGTFLSAQYTIESNGSIKVQASFGGSQTKGSFSGTQSYYIPTVAQVTSCKPCHFTSTGTATIAGLSLKEHLNETVTSMGAHPVTVPAGRYDAEELHMVLDVTSSASGIATSDSTTYDLYLAKNVGMVETSAGMSSTTVAGHTEKTGTGAEELVKYTT